MKACLSVVLIALCAPVAAQEMTPAQPNAGGSLGGMMQMPEQCRMMMQNMPASCMGMMGSGGMSGGSQASTGGAGMMPSGLMRHGRMGTGAHMKLMFAIVDTDGDGALTFEEVTAVHRRLFNVIDGNKDGKVSKEELEAFMRGG